MLKPIKLQRKADAPTFKDERGGEYPTPVIKVQRVKEYEFGHEMVLVFGLYASSEALKPSLILEKRFNSRSVEPFPDQETGQIIDLGYPNLKYTLENLLGFDSKGFPMLKSEGGIPWLIHSTHMCFPNSLGEKNLSNWEFVNDETT